MEKKTRAFKHLTYRDRVKIEMMLMEKASTREIADALHVSYQTIWRELRREGVWYDHTLSDLTTERRYSADIAQAQYEVNKRAKGGAIKLGHDYALHDFIEQKIGKEHYSPAAVIMEIKLLGLQFDVSICEKTIYNYINSGDVFLTITNKDLPERGTHKREYKQVREAKRQARGEGIENRPEEINRREEVGHWEMDTVKGKKNGRKCALMLSERKTRAQIVMPMSACTMEQVVSKLDWLERRWGEKFSSIFKSITVDNGSEFMDYEGMMTSKKSGEQRTQVYYCHPYRSNERGTNENQNRYFRRFFPKGTDLDKVPDEDIAAVGSWINNYPRKLLDGKTAGMLFNDFVEALA
ncbi:MAG: IS30 family transposase [Eubacteriales bacterium]|nr:IS30 family transposase [Eubacteriales bacterium]